MKFSEGSASLGQEVWGPHTTPKRCSSLSGSLSQDPALYFHTCLGRKKVLNFTPEPEAFFWMWEHRAGPAPGSCSLSSWKHKQRAPGQWPTISNGFVAEIHSEYLHKKPLWIVPLFTYKIQIDPFGDYIKITMCPQPHPLSFKSFKFNFSKNTIRIVE